MKNLLRQTNDPEVEAGLEETRPFFWFLILVLVFVYGISVYSSPELREPVRLIPYTTLFFIHIALHWYMPYVVTKKGRLAAYLVVQILLVISLILISQQPFIVIGLFSALAGETIGILEDWRRSLVAVAGYLALMGITYGLMWGWDTAPGWLGSALLVLLFVLIYVMLFMRQLNARAESQRLLAELQEAHTQLAGYAQQALQIAGQAKERARSSLAGARRAIDDLRTTDGATTEVISREVDRFRTATGIPCTLDMPPELHLSERVGEHVVRCVSEGLANVARHARATQVWLTIGEENDLLRIEIRDNGQGFDPNGIVPAGHYGLFGLRERARLANGELVIESEPDAGTTLRMMLPAGMDNGEQV